MLVTLSGTHMTRTKNEVIKLKKLLFYRRFVDTKTRRKKNDLDIIFENFNIIQKQL